MSYKNIKFKFWLGHTKKMTYSHSIDEINKVIPEFTNDIIPLQFSGYKDESQREIYKGDILSPKWKGEVFQNSEGTFMVKFHNNPTVNKPVALKRYLKHRTKAGTAERDNNVIGNVHEHPDLISN
jgi:hypothetical protein